MSLVVLISDLFDQSAAFIFLDGSRVSEGLVRVSYGLFGFPSVCRHSYLCALMAATNVVNVVVHSLVADSSLLDCCDLVVCFFTLCLQVGHRLRF